MLTAWYSARSSIPVKLEKDESNDEPAKFHKCSFEGRARLLPEGMRCAARGAMLRRMLV